MDRELEQLLKSLPLREPSAALDQRISAEAARVKAEAAGSGTAAFAGSLGQLHAVKLAPHMLQAASPPTSSGSAGAGQNTSTPARHRGSYKLAVGFAGLITAAAAIVLLAIVIMDGQENPDNMAATGPILETVAIDQPVRHNIVVSHYSDEGVIYLDERTPVRQIRHRTLEKVRYHDAQRDIEIESTVPSESVLLLPIAFD